MLRSTRSPSAPAGSSLCPGTLRRSRDADESASAYGGTFWLIYASNTSLMVAVSLLFRYSDFVHVLGGTAMHLGLIAGIGMCGSLAMRIFQGVGIDRHGPRLVWLLSLALFVASMLGHLAIGRVDTPAIYLVRILMMTSLAGAFGASITFVSLRVPENRMAEVIGTLGSSGFVGIALGPVLGDLLFAGSAVEESHVRRMFWLAAAAGTISLIGTAIATRGHLRRLRPRRRISPWTLVRRYHPGALLLVGAAMGLGIGLPGTFLRPYAEHVHLAGIKTFFLVYAFVAFAVRIAGRRLPERLGIRPVILLGLGSLAASMLLYLWVSDPWTLALPAAMGGVAHAFLFPAVVAGASSTFPVRYRGLATTLILAMFDIGMLLGQPLAGGIVEFSRLFGLPPYGTMFVTVASVLLAIAALYTLLGRRGLGPRKRPKQLARMPSLAPKEGALPGTPTSQNASTPPPSDWPQDAAAEPARPSGVSYRTGE